MVPDRPSIRPVPTRTMQRPRGHAMRRRATASDGVLSRAVPGRAARRRGRRGQTSFFPSKNAFRQRVTVTFANSPAFW
jgi:hypothetical protein